jgi:hypothetical protein
MGFAHHIRPTYALANVGHFRFPQSLKNSVPQERLNLKSVEIRFFKLTKFGHLRKLSVTPRAQEINLPTKGTASAVRKLCADEGFSP